MMGLELGVPLSLFGVGAFLIAFAYFARRFVRNMHNVGGELARMSAMSLYFLGGLLTLAGVRGALVYFGLW